MSLALVKMKNIELKLVWLSYHSVDLRMERKIWREGGAFYTGKFCCW